MEPDYIETARLMARFKQQVSRTLDMSVDLNVMARDPRYAFQILADVEGRARDAELTATLRQLRERLGKVLPAGKFDLGEGAGTGGGRARFIRSGRSD
ncbi:MAG: hypothetical protein JNM61_01245 [Zoogloeaceae bacterium]|nr:hypothetical protein [Zoogloeaceae bacterium]